MWQQLSTKLTLTVFLLLFHSSLCRIVKWTCTKSSDCPANASCENQTCFCNAGFIEEFNNGAMICLKAAVKYGDNCTKDIQCNVLLGRRSNCFHNDPDNAVGMCICNDDSHYREEICHLNAFVGEKCKVSSDCIIETPGLLAYCDYGKCICPPNHVPSPNNKDCLPTSDLHKRCYSVNGCRDPNAKCDEYCQCKVGFVASSDSRRCLTAAETLNDSCEEDLQCTEFLKFSKCDLVSLKCACQNYTHRLNDECWMSTGLGELCEYDSECYVVGDRSGVRCHKGFCKCKQGYSKLESSCIIVNEARIGIVSESKRINGSNSIIYFLLIFTIKYFLMTQSAVFNMPPNQPY